MRFNQNKRPRKEGTKPDKAEQVKQRGGEGDLFAKWESPEPAERIYPASIVCLNDEENSAVVTLGIPDPHVRRSAVEKLVDAVSEIYGVDFVHVQTFDHEGSVPFNRYTKGPVQ